MPLQGEHHADAKMDLGSPSPFPPPPPPVAGRQTPAMASSFMPGAPMADRAAVIAAAAAAAADEAMLDAVLVGVSSGSVLEPRPVDGESVADNLVAIINQEKDKLS